MIAYAGDTVIKCEIYTSAKRHADNGGTTSGSGLSDNPVDSGNNTGSRAGSPVR